MKSLKAKDFMTKYVFTVSPDTTVQELVGLFVTHPVSAIPVVGDDNFFSSHMPPPYIS